MGLRLENTVPGPDSDPVAPGSVVALDFKSDTGSVALGTIRVDLAYSNIVSRPSTLPTEDAQLVKDGVTAVLASPDRRTPLGPECFPVSGAWLLIDKTSDGFNDLSVYEVSADARTYDSVLGHFTFKRGTWAERGTPFCNLTRIVAPYFAVESGVFNTIATVLLRAGATPGLGSIVFGGVPTADGQARMGQQELPWAWDGANVGDSLELFILFNQKGYSSPFIPADTPVIEVWGKLPTDNGPILLGTTTPGSFGEFPTVDSGDSNSRLGTSGTARLFFGNIGATGDVLELQNWGLYTDYRLAVRNGSGLSGADVSVEPDSPIIFYAPTDRSLTTAKRTWFKYGTFEETPYFQPGRKLSPLLTSITKPNPGIGYVRRYEGSLVSQASGVLVEAFMSINSTIDGGTTGAGISIDEGLAGKSYRLIAVNNDTRKTLGLLLNRNQLVLPDLSGYSLLTEDIDYTSLKLVRLVVDRARGFVDVFVEGTRLLHLPIASAALASGTDSFIGVGYVENTTSVGNMGVASILYSTRYESWIPGDGLPDAGPFTVESVGSPTVALGQALTLTCPSGTKNAYSIPIEMYTETGLFLESKVQVQPTTGTLATIGTLQSGAGISFDTIEKRFTLGFFDCGIHGPIVAVIPGSGSVSDILSQTELGRSFSIRHDWSQETTYRVIYRPYKSIDVYVNNFKGLPRLSIPWRNNYLGFDLPEYGTVTPKLYFGQLDSGVDGAISNWKDIQWGESSGIGMTVKVDPTTLGENTFGGKLLVFNSFDEQP